MPVNQHTGANEHQFLSDQQSERNAGREAQKVDDRVERTHILSVFSRIIDYIFYAIYLLIGIEFILNLINSQQTNTFKTFLDSLTSPILNLFQGRMYDPIIGQSQIKLSYTVALITYLLLHYLINQAFRAIKLRSLARKKLLPYDK